MDYLFIFGSNVREARLSKSMTQEDLAEAADLHRTYIGSIERGERNVSLKNIVAIANALSIEPSTLLTFKKKLEDK